MTSTDWRSLPAGRELDAVIAMRVFGREVPSQEAMQEEVARVRVTQPHCWQFTSLGGFYVDIDGTCVPKIPRYSRHFAAAWEVVERYLGLGFVMETESKDGWHSVSLWPLGHRDHAASMGADTAPLAICRAALAAMEAR